MAGGYGIITRDSSGGGGGTSTVTNIILTASDFTAGEYTNADLVGLTADTGFFLFSDEGSGVLLKEGDGYTFDSGTGTITATAGNYRLQIVTN